MTKIRLGQAALALLSAAGCAFDTTPTTPPRDDGGSAATSLTRRSRTTSLQMRPVSSTDQAGTASITSDDAGMRGRDADAGRTIVGSGQPAQQPAKRDAGPSAAGSAGSAPSMPAPAAQDASVPAMTTPPTMPSECRPGVYTGVFDGPVTFAVGSINAVSGTVTAELVPEASGDYLAIRNGVITGMDSAGVGMSAKWTGRLSCATKQLENGLLTAGAWENGTTFTGMLEGMYSLNPYALSGTWRVESGEIPFAGGNGNWRMTLRDTPAPAPAP